jgi:Porin PorA
VRLQHYLEKRFVKKSVCIAFGIILLGLAALWQFGLSAHWTQRIQLGWSWDASFIGVGTIPDPTTGSFPAKDPISTTERRIAVISVDQAAGAVMLEDQYIVKDPLTGQVTWEYVYRAPVDPQTGAHLDAQYRGDFFVFPREVEKTTYQLRYSYLKGVPVAFQREEQIEGVPTYLFSYKGRGEYTESYAGTAEYPGINVQPGQEIKCADDQFAFNVWVEPLTGEMLKVAESCNSGDYVFDIATGKALTPVLRWSGVTLGDDIIRRAEQIRSARTAYLWASRYLPVGLLIAGLLALGLGALPLTVRKIRYVEPA